VCGFVVIIERDPSAVVDRDLLESATACLRHRGPDAVGIEVVGNVGFGFRRLAVIDPGPGGAQPMRGAGRVLVYNGELYGYREQRERLSREGVDLLGRSDTEVLLHTLARGPAPEVLPRLRGMFAFACWDTERRRLLVARDRLGQKPLYVWQGPQRTIVASELKAILADPSAPRELDPAALNAYLTFFTIPEPLSILPGVEKVPPATWLELDEVGREVSRGDYWDPADQVASAQIDRREAAEELLRRLRRSIELHLVADVPVGAFLSGGLDSAGVVALASEARRRAGSPPLDTFSVAFRGSPLDESQAAAQTASALGTRHHQIDVTPDLLGDLPTIAWHLDEPFGVASAAATYYLARAAREHVTVALSGDGADELFGGYPWRHARLAPNQLVAGIPARARRLLARFAPPGAGEDLGGPDSGGSQDLRGRVVKWLGALGREDASIYADLLRGFRRVDVQRLLSPEVLRAAGTAETSRFERFFAEPVRGDGVTRSLYAETRTTLCHEMLAKVDRMSMAWGLEVRVPYLDEDVVAAALAFPSRVKVGPRTGKQVLRRALAPLLPTHALRGPKRGFTVPVGSWVRDQLLGEARAQLESLGRRGFLRAGAPGEVLERHLKGPHDRGGQVFALLALEAWCRVYLDGTRTSR
jgi:asparagine synthase (glutamine-hydrolysing)